MYPPREVTRMLGLKSSTLSHYARTFSVYMSPSANKYRRLYTDQDIAILEKIRELSQEQGVKLAEIPRELDKIIDHQDIPEEKALALPGLIAIVTETKEILEKQSIQLDHNHADIERIKIDVQRLRLDLEKEKSMSFFESLRYKYCPWLNFKRHQEVEK